MVSLGHRRIGCISGAMTTPSSKERFFGYIRALQKYGIAFDSSIVYEGDYRSDSGIRGAKVLIKKEVTAVFCCNDMMACGAYKEIIAKGLRVPEDISLVGYDDMPFVDFLEIPLTTVRQPTKKWQLNLLNRCSSKSASSASMREKFC